MHRFPQSSSKHVPEQLYNFAAAVVDPRNFTLEFHHLQVENPISTIFHVFDPKIRASGKVGLLLVKLESPHLLSFNEII